MPLPDGTPSPIVRVAVIGTGLIGTSVALAARRAGADVVGWDLDGDVLAGAAASGGLTAATSATEAVRGADLVVIATPIDRKSTRLNSSHTMQSRMPSSA